MCSTKEGMSDMQQAVVKQKPWTFYLRALLYVLVALMIRALALAPLLALYLIPAGSPWRFSALLCPALMILWVLPLRYSFAEALVQRGRSRYFSFDTALGLSGYGEKLTESLLHALNVLKWGVPLAALLAYGVYCKDYVDAKTLMTALVSMGKGAGDFCYSIANFFATLFGGAPVVYVAGSLMQGLYVVLAVLGLAAGVLVYGALRNSCNRYIWVLANRGERSPRTEIRRRMCGRRWRQLLVGLCNLLLLSPFLLVVALTLKEMIGDVSSQLLLMLSNSGATTLDVRKALSPLTHAFVLLYLPLLPARRMITAAFATRKPRHTAPVQHGSAQTSARDKSRNASVGETVQAMPEAVVPDWVSAEMNAEPNAPQGPDNGASMNP